MVGGFKHTFVRGSELLLVVFIIIIVVGQFFGQPILIAFVETGSMAPEMEPGDGFVAVPSALSGSIEEGDVVTFRAKTVQGGGLTTHRIVGEKKSGYVTKGDANPFTDQAGGEPPVQNPQIVAEALQVGGSVVVIPRLGTGILTVRDTVQDVQRYLARLLGTRSLLGLEGVGYLVLAATIGYYFATGLTGGESRKQKGQSRNKEQGTDPRIISLLFVVLLVSSATAAMVVPAGTQEYDLLSTDSQSDRSYVVSVDESKTQAYSVHNGGLLPTVVYLEPASDKIEVQSREMYVRGQSTKEATVKLKAPSKTGVFNRYLTEHRYLAILPTPVIHSLYTVHPWLPIVVIDALIGIPFYLFGVTLLGTGRIRERSKNRILPIRTRIRKTLKKQN